MPAAIKVNLRRSFSRMALSFAMRPFTLIRPSGEKRKAKSVFLSTLPPTSRRGGGEWRSRDKDEEEEKEGKERGKPREDRDAVSYLFRLFGSNPAERLLLLRTLAVPCR